MPKDFNSKIFSKKRKQKYPRNIFFSYSGKNIDDKNFQYKDFRNSNSIHSSFKRCNFFGTLFQKSNLKYCCFSGAKFVGISFINCNFNGSRFIGTTFDNCIFKNCRFQKCKFKNAKFINTYIENSSFKNSFGLDFKKYSIKNLQKVDDLYLKELNNEYAGTNLSTFLNRINISRLLAIFSEEDIKSAFEAIKQNNKIKEAEYSHMLYKIYNKNANK